MEKYLQDMTLQDFRDIKPFRPIGVFNAFTIVPTDEIHDSGYRCMKFVLDYHNEIVGCCGGYSDVVNLNGIGGYGRDWKTSLMTGKIDVIDWTMDCLTESGLIHVFTHKYDLELAEFIGSDFKVFIKRKERRKS